MISKQQVEHIAKLARLRLSEKEIEKMQKDLAMILDYFNLLQEIDTGEIKPALHSISVKNVMREDRVKEEKPETVDKMLSEAPQKEKRYIKVKEILS